MPQPPARSTLHVQAPVTASNATTATTATQARPISTPAIKARASNMQKSQAICRFVNTVRVSVACGDGLMYILL